MTRKIFISAGEHSGDLLGADLVSYFTHSDVEFYGVVGDHMKRAGVKELISLEELNLIGFWEVIKHIGSLALLEKKIIASFDEFKPDLAILIDFPGLHFRLAEELYLRGIKVVQYVAPKVWAWGQHRAERLRKHFHLVLGVLPFEEAFFKENRVNYHYVGSPHRQRIDDYLTSHPHPSFTKPHPIIALLPGSRLSELEYILPVMFEIKKIIDSKKQISWLLPLAENLDRKLVFSRWPWLEHDNNMQVVPAQSFEVMRSAHAGLIASGTATLECALLGTPMVVTYVMSSMNYRVAKQKIKLPWVSLINLILGKECVKEFIQEFSMENVAQTLLDLVENTPARTQMLADFSQMRGILAGNASENSAHLIQRLLEE